MVFVRCKVLCCSVCMCLVAFSNNVWRMTNRMRQCIVSGLREEGNYTFSALFGGLNIGGQVFALAMAWNANLRDRVGYLKCIEWNGREFIIWYFNEF